MGTELKTAEELKQLGNQAFAEKNYVEAIKLYTQAIQKDPINNVYFSNRSASYGGMLEWQKAYDDAKECIRLDPTFVKGYYRLATAQMELREFDGALATIRQGLEIDANNPQLTKQMRIVQQQKKLELAKIASTTLSSVSPEAQAGYLDAATSRELRELQVAHAETLRELNNVQVAMSKAQRDHKLAQLTSQELADLPETTNCYRSVGKMFLQSSKQGIQDHLQSSVDNQTKVENDMTKKLEYLERQAISQRRDMEELIKAAGESSTSAKTAE